MVPIVIDTETYSFGVARMAPPLISLAVADGSGVRLWHVRHLGTRSEVYRLWEGAAAGEYLLIGHNIAYDVGVILAQYRDQRLFELVFTAYDQGAVSDTMIRQKLLDIANGCYRGYRQGGEEGVWIKFGYHLVDLSVRLLGKKLNKETTWRTRFAELETVSIEDWPPEARGYASEDGAATWGVWKVQVAAAEAQPGVLIDEARQVRAALALHFMSVWGIRTDREGVLALKNAAEAQIRGLTPILVAAGLLNPKTGSRRLKAALDRMKKVNPGGRLTKGGVLGAKKRLALDEEACGDSGDPVLVQFSEYTKAQNILAKDVAAMAQGVGGPIHSRFDSLVETGRTSSSGPNLQNPRRMSGVRECFVPREGCYFASCDFDMVELHTLAQMCLEVVGHSRLADLLNRGFDPHLDLGAQILGITYEEAVRRRHDLDVKKARQNAKPANFGFPGGMGVDGFRAYAKGAWGADFTEDEAKRLKAKWFVNWPEMHEYFRWVGNTVGGNDAGSIKHYLSDRWRGLVSYTVACNSFFQGLAADGAKAAMWAVCKAEYVQRESPLYGCRTVNFIHDELLVEVPIPRAHEAAIELQRVMVEAFNPWVPDVPTGATVALMKRWSKGAEPVWREGRLIPWEDRKQEGKR